MADAEFSQFVTPALHGDKTLSDDRIQRFYFYGVSILRIFEELFRQRCAALGVEVVSSADEQEGDIVLEAAAGIASTGSVLLLGEATLRRPLLAAKRTVIRLRSDQLVRYPSNLVNRLGDGEALILTGASRTADIEKIIVRGIHGPETMVVVLSE